MGTQVPDFARLHPLRRHKGSRYPITSPHLSRGAPMNAVRLPALVHPAFDNTTGFSGAPSRSAVDRDAWSARGSRLDTSYLA